MKFEMKIVRNGDAERAIGRVWANLNGTRVTALDLSVLDMSIDGLPEFGHLICEDDLWTGHHASRDDVWEWEQKHLPEWEKRAHDRTGWLVEATADMFPLSWQPIGLMFSDGATVWSADRMKTCGRCGKRKPGVRERKIKCHSSYGACWDPRCGTTETVCSACLYGTVTVTTGEKA